jgi:hypothetical protein
MGANEKPFTYRYDEQMALYVIEFRGKFIEGIFANEKFVGSIVDTQNQTFASAYQEGISHAAVLKPIINSPKG